MKVLPNVSQAAENTPEHRDRIVDAVRGVSLVVVVFGHLLLAVVYWPPEDPPRLGSLMLAYPWTQVLTWILQVMPLFFAFIMFSFPSGLVLYFCINMLLTIGQQYIIRRRLAAEPAAA